MNIVRFEQILNDLIWEAGQIYDFDSVQYRLQQEQIAKLKTRLLYAAFLKDDTTIEPALPSQVSSLKP